MTTVDLAITVNGERRAWPTPRALDALLTELGLDPRLVVVEHNRRIVRRAALADTVVAPGDHIEIVHFVGGG